MQCLEEAGSTKKKSIPIILCVSMRIALQSPPETETTSTPTTMPMSMIPSELNLQAKSSGSWWPEDGIIYKNHYWLLVDLPLWKIWVNWEGLSHIWKIKNGPNHQPLLKTNWIWSYSQNSRPSPRWHLLLPWPAESRRCCEGLQKGLNCVPSGCNSSTQMLCSLCMYIYIHIYIERYTYIEGER